MPEPTTTTVATSAAAAAGVTVFGFATGLQLDALLPGLFGGVMAMSRVDEPLRPLKRLTSLFLAALVAGWFTQLGVELALAWLPWPQTVSPVVVKSPVAFFLGFYGFRRLAEVMDDPRELIKKAREIWKASK